MGLISRECKHRYLSWLVLRIWKDSLTGSERERDSLKEEVKWLYFAGFALVCVNVDPHLTLQRKVRARASIRGLSTQHSSRQHQQVSWKTSLSSTLAQNRHNDQQQPQTFKAFKAFNHTREAQLITSNSIESSKLESKLKLKQNNNNDNDNDTNYQRTFKGVTI